MKRVCASIGFLVFLQGAAGLVNEWTGWFRFWTLIRRLDFVGPHTSFVSIVLIVTGVAVMVAADRIRE
ncbi:hypothetical protein [Streptomyces sp. NPDC056061]|uniref:hypothetical protein n=1 Tax=Streptomyces sp. NPDC056061 TaxID=3345700 RepID=UPI0035DC2A1E